MPNDRLNLIPGPQWSSLEALLDADEAALAAVRAGAVASLTTQTGTYKLLAEDDFQALLGQAQDVRRLSTVVDEIATAAQAASEHPGEDSLQELLALVSAVKDASVLAVQHGPGALVGEHLDCEDAEGVIADPVGLRALLRLHP